MAEKLLDHLRGELVFLRHGELVTVLLRADAAAWTIITGVFGSLQGGVVAELHFADPVGLGLAMMPGRLLLPDAQVGLLRVQAQTRE